MVAIIIVAIIVVVVVVVALIVLVIVVIVIVFIIVVPGCYHSIVFIMQCPVSFVVRVQVPN